MTSTNDSRFENKISVIVPIFRVEQYLERCLDSILAQSYTNLEIILIDDGSDDKCPQICDEYAKKDSRIVVVHQENRGVADARNIGLKKASGDFITFVDPDDYINNHMYEILMNQIIDFEADIAMCDYKYVYDNDVDKMVHDNLPVNVSKSVLNGKEALLQGYASYQDGVTFSVLWNKLCKKSLYDDIDFPSKRIYEDEASVFKILYKASRIIYLNQPLYFYHQHKASIVGKKLTPKNIQLLDAYIDKLNFYNQKKEYFFWTKELSHLLHMFCFLQYRFDKENIKQDIFKGDRAKSVKKTIQNIGKKCKMDFRLKTECFLFMYFPNIYFFI